MFERFTDRSRRVIVLAQDAAREMGHAKIDPEHLLVGLREAEGLAAKAMAQAGVVGAGLRERVASLYPSSLAAKNIDKVPFSTEAKQCLEQALRAALALGHNYIGTEHLLLGVQRQAEAANRSFDKLLGVSMAELHRRLTEMLSGTPGPATRSPALHAALERARVDAGQAPTTTGHVLAGMLSDPDSQAARALTTIGVDAQQVQAALAAVSLADTSDASPVPQTITLTVGGATRIVADARLAALLQRLTGEELRELLRRALEHPDPGEAAG